MSTSRPPTYRLGESFITGIKELDADHQDLVGYVNLIACAEQRADSSGLLDALGSFREDLRKHFEVEEAHLAAAEYPMAASHAEHHSEIISKLDSLIADVQQGIPVPDVAGTCYHELVSVVLLRDMKFVNWFADRKSGMR